MTPTQAIRILKKMAKSKEYTQPVDIYHEREALIYAISVINKRPRLNTH